MRKKIFPVILLILISVNAYSKSISGRLVNKKNKAPVAHAIIQIIETQQWTISNEEGIFVFDDVQLSRISLGIRHIGMQDFYQTFEITFFNGRVPDIELTPQRFDMPEVTVTATKGREISSTSNIDYEAMEHVQPTTLGDVMQLLPGNLIDNPDLSEKQAISIREVGNEPNSSMGTAIIVDGMPVNNDANYQVYSTTATSATLTSTTSALYKKTESTAGEGIDLRQISTDEIESVKIIKGIPSVEYGNLTSGAVIVNTKAGRTPFEVKLKSDPKIKHVYLGKGLGLKDGAALNTSIVYTKSYKDLRTQYTSFDRLTARLSYSKVFFKNSNPLSFNSGVSFFQTIDNEKTDPDALVKEEKVRDAEKGIGLNTRIKWVLNKALLTNLESKFSVSVNWQEYYQKQYRSSGIEKISLARIEGENEGIYLPSESLTELTIKGKPVKFFGSIKGDKHWSLGERRYNNIMGGIEYSLSVNKGEGRIYDITNPPSVERNASRPRSYKDIPASAYVSLFVEDKYVQPIGSTLLTAQLGMRINNFQPKDFLGTDVGYYVEPRFNLDYNIFQSKQSFIKQISIHGGIGLNYKAPPLLYLYPDKAYFDLVSLDYYNGNQETEMAYFTTHVYDTSNENLKPSRNLKKEIGIEFKVGSIKGDITAFSENLSDGFGMVSDYQFIDYKVYDSSGVPEGQKPVISELPYTNATYIIGYSTPANNKKSNKYGVEYDLDLGKIEPLSTSVSVNGAWLKTKRIFSTTSYDRLPTKDEAGQYSEIGVYPAGEAKISERFNTTFRFITHSQRYRLVFTTTVQALWYDKSYYTYYDDAPLYLYSREQSYIPFTDDMRADTNYRKYIDEKGENYYMKETMPALFLFNFKLSKEIDERFKLSFFANNFFNYRPRYQYERSLSYTRRNPSIYFGAELKIKI